MGKEEIMVLGFKQGYGFVEKIGAKTKVHSIREDKHNRWHAGMRIHMATGVRTKGYCCFNDKDECKSTQRIEIKYINKSMGVPVIIIDGREHWFVEDERDRRVILALANNDGFDTIRDFCKWFDRDFVGKIIHWTDLRY